MIDIHEALGKLAERMRSKADSLPQVIAKSFLRTDIYDWADELEVLLKPVEAPISQPEAVAIRRSESAMRSGLEKMVDTCRQTDFAVPPDSKLSAKLNQP